jgi:hypothetical protein
MSIKKEFSIPEGLNPDTVVITKKGKEFTIGEIQNSNRVYKSATPKQDLSWYVKWTASMFILTAVLFRAQGPQWQFMDQVFSLVGTIGWTWVGILWKDRALIMLNAVLVFILSSAILGQLLQWL